MSYLGSIDLMTIAAMLFAIATLVSAAYVLRASRKRLDCLEGHINDLGKELNALSHASMGMGRKLKSLTDQNQKLETCIDEIQNNDPVKVSYSEAARLVTMGASVEELMSACGISRPEAELVSALTKQAKNDEGEPIPTLNVKE